MKIIKEFSKFENSSENFFTENEVLEIKDLYTDLVDDLNLITVESENQLTKPMCSFFKINSQFSLGNKFNSKVFSINISIRTAKLDDYDDHVSFATPSKSDSERYKMVSEQLVPFIQTVKSFGYSIEKNDIDIKLDSWKYITGGIKLIIMK
jgi:hypothetical protein